MSSVLSQTFVYGLGLAAAKGLSLLMVPVFTYFFEPADYGRLDIIQTLADLLSILIGLGLSDTLFKFAGQAANESERRRTAANLFGFSLIIAGIVLVISQVAAPLVAELLPGGVTLIQTRLILGTLAMSGISMVMLSWVRMQELAGLYLFASLGRVVAQALAAVFFLWLGLGVTGVLVAGLVAASALCIGLIVWCLRNISVSFDLSQYYAYLIYGGPLVLTGIAGFFLGSFDRWILADAVGPAKMAEYALAAKMALITAIAIQPFDLWWLPNRFKVLQKQGGPQKCAQAVSIGVSLAVTAAVGVAVGGPSVIRLMTPEAYHGAVAFVPWLAVLAAVHAVTTMMNQGVMSGRVTFYPLLIDSVAALVALVGYFILIPFYGGYGAITATAIALTGRLIATYLIGQRILPIPYQLKRILVLAVSGMAVIIFLPRMDGIIVPMICAVLLSGGVLMFSLVIQLLPKPGLISGRYDSD